MSQVMIVTGGGRGIGRETAKLAARHGYAVAVNYVKDERAASAIADEIRSLGGAAIAVGADVSREGDVVRLFATVDQELGRVTALVNSAGVVDRQSHVADVDEARLYRMFAVNVIGSFLCAKEAILRMSTARGGTGGSIVNVSSAAARHGSPGEYVDYAASKGAIDTFTLGLAREVAREGI
ncbi:MAG TPA: SDR family NAD(P)-dependent oxidoreductase, partial [Polyangiaceae bacterium]|nr:SDR family NAD(P)-dependent oxidoreductase [Polyangiaceae bacterium]